MKDKKHSNVTKQKMSLSAIGKPKSEKMKEKLSDIKSFLKINIYDKNTLNKAMEFNSTKECAIFLGISQVKVRDICYGKYGIFNEYVLRFQSEMPIQKKTNRNITITVS